MPQEIVMTLVNDCECTETGECVCAVHPDGCMCECECDTCETEYVACACGGNCGCDSAEETYWN